MTEHKGTNWNLIMKIVGFILTLFVLYFGIINDRANIVAQVNENAKDIKILQKDNGDLQDIKWNLKLLMRSQGIDWESYNQK